MNERMSFHCTHTLARKHPCWILALNKSLLRLCWLLDLALEFLCRAFRPHWFLMGDTREVVWTHAVSKERPVGQHEVYFFNPHWRKCLLIGERETERDRERQRNIHRLPPVRAPTRDEIHNLGMCPDRGSNPPPFGAWSNTPTNRATWPGRTTVIFIAAYSLPFAQSLISLSKSPAWISYKVS